MTHEQLKNDNQIGMAPDELPKLFFPETVVDLFSRLDDKEHPERNEKVEKATEDFLKHLMFGFSVSGHRLLVTLLDKKDTYNNAELYLKETGKQMHPFCACLRGEGKSQCHMLEACQKFDREVANAILHQESNCKKYLKPFSCHAGMCDMAAPINIAERPFAVLLAGQIVPEDFDQKQLEETLQEEFDKNRLWLSDAAKETEKKVLFKKLMTCIDDNKDTEHYRPLTKDEIYERWLSLKALADQLEQVFNGMYQVKRNYSEGHILAEIRKRLRNLRFVEGKYPLGNILKHLSKSLGLEGMLLLRGADKMRPLHRMELIASSATQNLAGNKIVMSLSWYWHTLVSTKYPILLHDDKWLNLRSEIFRTTGLCHYYSETTPTLVVVNKYEFKPNTPQDAMPLLLLGIGEAANSGLGPFLDNLLQEFETVIEVKSLKEELIQHISETDNQLAAYGHSLTRPVQNISNIYDSFERVLRLVNRSSELELKKFLFRLRF